MISPAFMKYCNGTELIWNKGGECEMLTALENEKCFLFMYGDWRKFYEKEFVGEVFDKMKRVGGYFIHIWNKMLDFNNKKYTLAYDSGATYIELAKVYCPRVLETRINF
jgi:hypothetical protein